MYNHFHTCFLLLHFTLRSSEPDCVGNIRSVSFSVLSKYIGVFLQVNLFIFPLIKTENTTQGWMANLLYESFSNQIIQSNWSWIKIKKKKTSLMNSKKIQWVNTLTLSLLLCCCQKCWSAVLHTGKTYFWEMLKNYMEDWNMSQGKAT